MKYKVPYINLPLSFSNDQAELLNIFIDVCSNGRFILRQEVDEFESAIANFVGVRHAIGLNSGTDALFLGLKALGIGKGDEVITVAHTFVATIAAIVHCGATPVLVDIREDDFTMDSAKFAEAITPRTKAVLPVHLNGRVCQMNKIREIAHRHNLLIIEDAAQAMGSRYNDLMAGAIGNCGCFSFHPMKTLSCLGDGGLLTTNDDKLASSVRLLRNHGQKNKQNITEYGFNSRLDNLQAAVLLSKLQQLPKLLARRRFIAEKYSKGLSQTPLLDLPLPPAEGIYWDTYNSFVIKTPKRDALQKDLTKAGIETFVHWNPSLTCHTGLKISSYTLPVTDRISQQVLSLPIFPEMTEKQIDYVITRIIRFFDKEPV